MGDGVECIKSLRVRKSCIPHVRYGESFNGVATHGRQFCNKGWIEKLKLEKR